MRKRRERTEVHVVITSKVPNICNIMTASGNQQPLFRIKLCKINIATRLIFWVYRQ